MTSIQLGADVFTQAAQQPAPIPEVNALPFPSPAVELAPLTLTLFFFASGKNEKRRYCCCYQGLLQRGAVMCKCFVPLSVEAP